ncbi:MAG: hypothetical protein ACRENO_03425, partial [Thermodesulfobacteriota bacterium]
ICILGITSFSLFASAVPFYLGYDDVNYGLSTINLSHGSLTITNELFQNTGDSEFIPRAYVKTLDNLAIPINNIGINVLGAFFYLIGGFYGLLYFGPIVTVLFLILYERITSKFFGNLVGLLALLLMVADWDFFFVGLRFLTDNIFSLFFILGVFSIIKFLQNKNEKYVLFSSTFFVVATFFRINGIAFFPAEIIIVLGFFIFQYMKNSKIINKTNNVHNAGIVLRNLIITKSNFIKFLKISFFLLTPWLIFLAFWFSYNDYFFGQPFSNYRDQFQPTPETIFGNQFERIKLVQYFSVPLIPDPLYFFLIIVSNTDLDAFRSDIWISYITFALVCVILIFSLFFKIKRSEVLTMVLFIIAVVGFYSSPLGSPSPTAENLSEGANNRYMIPCSLITFILVGFILVESWDRCFSKNSKWNKKILGFTKLIYLILVVIFFLALLIVMPSIQDLYQRGFHFNNPLQFASSFEDLEKLPAKSLVVSYESRYTLLYTDTHFYPYLDDFIENNGNATNISQSKLTTLKKILNDGYNAYTFKTNIFPYDAKYFELLEAYHGIILKDYSDTFCKLELVDYNASEQNNRSDLICFKDVKEKRPKIWPVTLRWNHN